LTDHADVCFRRLLFSLNETYGGNAIFHGNLLHSETGDLPAVCIGVRYSFAGWLSGRL
jgi:hypothetical protein